MAVAAGKMELKVCRDAASLAAEAADRIMAAAKAAIAKSGRFTLVLSGGSTPERTYQLLAQPQRRSQIDWSRTWLFFGDERCVPSDDPRSNFHLANGALLKPANVPADHVLEINATMGTPANCASQYELVLKEFFKFGASSTQSGNAFDFPSFDVILLGLGDDGHTASLFPGKPSLDEKKCWITWSPPGVLPPPVDRITFTFPLINAAQEVMFLVAGAGKAAIVRDVLEGPADFHKHPSTGVRPDDGKLTWLLDEAAAGMLKRERGASTAAKKDL